MLPGRIWEICQNLLEKLFSRETGEETHRERLTRQAAGAFGINVLNTGLVFLYNLCFARVLGANSYGAYIYAMSWATLLTNPSLLGLDKLLVRETATYHEQSNWPLLRGFLGWSLGTILLSTFTIAAGAFLVGKVLLSNQTAEIQNAVLLSVVLIPLAGVAGAVGLALRGLGEVVRGQLPTQIIRPVMVLLFIAGVSLFIHDSLTAINALSIQLSATAVALCFSGWLLWRRFPKEIQSASPERAVRRWIRSALPLLAYTSLFALCDQVDILMLGSFKEPEAAGILAVAKRGAQLVAFPLLAANLALGPTVARFYAVNDRQRLQHAMTQSARMVFLASLPIALGLWLLGDRFLSLFGKEFVEGSAALKILIVGQLVNAGTGAGSVLLAMTGHERKLVLALGLVTILKTGLLFLVIPNNGLLGTAVVMTGCAVCLNLLYVTLSLYCLKINPIGLPVRRVGE